MSIILDALQRSEQESENNSQAPGLHTRHDAAGRARSWPGYLWLIGIILLLLLALMTGAWLQRDKAAPLLPAAPAAVVESVPAPVHAPVPESVAVVTLPASDSAEVAALYQQTSPKEQDENTQPAMDVEVITSLAQAELKVAPAASHSTPLIADLPQRIKDQIPSIFFRKHDWSSQPAGSSVQLNGGVFKAGDTVAPGLRLVEILPDSIVLDFRGEAFRLRALNSWVNL
jgi:general secretion pathway protein B